ncbi:MAG TPA: glycerol-3-phosphate 1-O-acyltransferase PlsY [Bacillota bacterium]|jgi:glycerol-3-phosphate acyltransferase PlsY
MDRLVVSLILGYLIGAVPFGFIAGRLLGVDVRKHGSGNIGATNVLRVIGARAAAPVLLLDAAKGAAPVYLARHLAAGVDPAWAGMLAGLAAIAGHNWSVFLGFKGGKGVATSAGVAIMLIPRYLLAGLGAFVVAVALTRYVSLGSILGALATGIYVLIAPSALPEKVFGVVGAVFIIYRHKANITRLLAGQESRVGQRPGQRR